MSIASALAGLLEVVEADRRQRCAEILGAAEAEASALLGAARIEARHRLRAALKAERARGDAQLAAARARWQAEERRRRQRLAQLSVAAAAGLLAPALKRCWNEESSRRRWIEAALTQAAARLPRRDWRLRHPAGLAEGDLSWLRERATALGVAAVGCEADSRLDAGIVIAVGDACLDATTAGLLADRAAVDGRLLYCLEVA
jgi:hypothetical protein